MRIPLWVEASRLKVLVFGGGSVGARRAKFFSAAGAKVRVLAKKVVPELQVIGVEIKLVDLYQYDPSDDIRWADVVVVAVDDPVLAEQLFRKAESMGKLVNDATDASRTHVVVPYERVVGGLRIAVTSEGAAGTPARLSLDVIEGCIKNSWIPLFFQIYKQLKAEAKEAIKETKKRLAYYQALVEDEEFLELVKAGRAQEALARGRSIMSKILIA
ncbi:bifunctional precorrin-2 dehydrogenase/sirohydrochlorin ferrochelatase [Pyrobaculum sp.]|uniref:precorrin-2 dehydrogenase/sirohydrochlorin ferrochelatase family protein n=1 Tax=Pyrobaculum sp. TaxID=2004705 RepID=UPI00316979E8